MNGFGFVVIRTRMLGYSKVRVFVFVCGLRQCLCCSVSCRIQGQQQCQGLSRRERSRWVVVCAERPDLVRQQLRELKVETKSVSINNLQASGCFNSETDCSFSSVVSCVYSSMFLWTSANQALMN